MKKYLMSLFVATIAFGVMAEPAAKTVTSDKGKIQLADARSKIDLAIESPKVMGELIKGLSAADQKQFLADVNKAISDMPASIEEKTAKFLNANHAALKNAAKGNVATLLAEVFATVPPEALTVLNERFASDLFNRAANPNITYTDEQYTKIALDLMKTINERTAETDSESTRSAFAIIMLLRASNGTPKDLADKLIDTLKFKDARELAKNEWIPAALGEDNRTQGYEPILASADAGRRPDLDFVLVIAGPQYLESILEDVVGKNTDQMSFMRTRTPVLDAVENPLVHRVPVLKGDIFDGGMAMPQGGRPGVPAPTPTPPTPPEPHPYGNQRSR